MELPKNSDPTKNLHLDTGLKNLALCIIGQKTFLAIKRRSHIDGSNEYCSIFYTNNMGISVVFVGAIDTLILLLLFPPLIPLSGVGTTCFSSYCDKDSAIIYTTGRLPDINPP
jgi:hypothetical protein